MHELLATVSEASAILNRLFDGRNIVFVMIFAIVAVSVISSVVKSITQTREREQTRREIAAYLSQGMLTDEQAAMLLNKGQKGSGGKSGWGSMCCRYRGHCRTASRRAPARPWSCWISTGRAGWC